MLRHVARMCAPASNLSQGLTNVLQNRFQRHVAGFSLLVVVGSWVAFFLVARDTGAAESPATTPADITAVRDAAREKLHNALARSQQTANRPISLASARSDGHRVAFDVAESAARFTHSSRFVEAVHYRLREGTDLNHVLDVFTMTLDELATLNPGVDLGALQGGGYVTVYRRGHAQPSLSQGAPNRGRLHGGVPMPQGEHWIVRNPRFGWGTPSTIMALVQGLTSTAMEFPGGTVPLVADLSARYGGRLRPHRSHQSGRDADVTYYTTTPGPSPGFRHVTAAQLDVQRQWHLYRYWIENNMVDYVFTDRRMIPALAMHAIEDGTPSHVYEAAFGRRGTDGIIRHERGHSDHLHVRFSCAQDDPICRATN
jgi:murein endopeptidase